jgi:hypothetical protein
MVLVKGHSCQAYKITSTPTMAMPLPAAIERMRRLLTAALAMITLMWVLWRLTRLRYLNWRQARHNLTRQLAAKQRAVLAEAIHHIGIEQRQLIAQQAGVIFFTPRQRAEQQSAANRGHAAGQRAGL